jgi:hypothetical protein
MAKERLYRQCGSAFLVDDVHVFLSYNWCSHKIEDPTKGWNWVVGDYSVLDLTSESDRLPAISALVSQIQPLRQGDVYISRHVVPDLVARLDLESITQG